MRTGFSSLKNIFCVFACLATVLLLRAGTVHAAQPAPVIEYLYVEANEGDSSGGHAAIRFDKQTFHFQHETPGIIRIRRLDSAAFRHMYAKLGNRTIRSSVIAVSGETYTLLLDAVTRLFLIQDAQLAQRDELRRDILFFELLLLRHQAAPRSTAEFPLPDKRSGFAPHAPAHAGLNADEEYGDIATLTVLRERILATYGGRFITERIARTQERIRALPLRAAELPLTKLSRDVYPLSSASASTSYYDALSALSALERLQAAGSLRSMAFLTSGHSLFRLEPEEALLLRAFADQQEEQLVRLVNSARPDWGGPFVTAMDRLAAIKASLHSGRLVFRDIFPATSSEQEFSRAAGTGRPDHIPLDYLPALHNERRAAFLHWRTEFFTRSTMREADYAALERSGNLLIDSAQALETGTSPREIPDASFSARTGVQSDRPVPGTEEAALKRELAAARLVATAYDAALGRLYSYNLVSRNCVTEIFAVINNAMGQQALASALTSGFSQADAGSESIKRLGGFVDPAGGLTFIPFVSAGAVSSSYAVVANRELPSYRRERLMEMERHESPLLVFLRESNTITSTIYRPTPDDSAFLFFTDGAVMLRPLFGAFNLLTGFGNSLLGLAALPFTGPDHLLSGVRGMLFSVPELAFVNLRKGSMAYAERSKDAP